MKPLVMVVDDDLDIRLALQDVLEDEGYDTQLCSDGLTALHSLKAPGPRPSVILLDMLMPVMDGRGFLDEVARLKSADGIPIIVLSASVSRGEAKHPRATMFFRKPFDVRGLIKTLSNLSVPVV